MKIKILLWASAIAFAPITAAQNYVVEPGTVRPGVNRATNRLLPNTVTSDFTLVQSGSGFPSKNGGACLVAHFPLSPEAACNVDDDCKRRFQAVAGGIARSGHGYCLSDTPNGASGERKCWYRPGESDTYCVKGLTMTANQRNRLPVVNVFPAHVDKPMSFKTPIQWRVLTCQNLVTAGCGKEKGVPGVDLNRIAGESRTFP